jgi:hypothetical protein
LRHAKQRPSVHKQALDAMGIVACDAFFVRSLPMKR